MRLLKTTVLTLTQTKQVRCARPFGYLTVGRVYSITLPKRATGDVYFKGEHGSTFERFVQVCKALETGALTII